MALNNGLNRIVIRVITYYASLVPNALGIPSASDSMNRHVGAFKLIT